MNNMNYKKLRELVSAEFYLDIEHAKEHELRVNYDPGDDTCWYTIDPQKFQKEEVLAAIINAKSQIKLASKPSAAALSKKTPAADMETSQEEE